MKITAQTAVFLARVNRGEIITDIGQVDAVTRRAFKQLLDKGYLQRGKDYTFPCVKTAWAGIRLTDDENPMLPANIVF